MGYRIPGAPNHHFDNKAPIFYSAMQKIEWTSGPHGYRAAKNKAMDERFATLFFRTPVPLEERRIHVQPCPQCFARLVLEGGAHDVAAAEGLVYL